MATVNGVALHYEAQGEGTALLLIPPEGMGAASWFRQVPAMRRLTRVVTYDPRGIGQSEAGQGWTVEEMARDAVGLLQTLDVAQAVVAGVDLGGFVALQLALDRPEMVRRLILAATAASGAPGGFLTDDARRLREETAAMDAVDRFRHDLGLMLAPGFTSRNPGLLDTLVENRRSQALGDEVLAAQRKAGEEWFAGGLSSLSTPTLIVAGQEDRFQRRDSVEALAAGIPGSRLDWIPQCGHLPHIERADVFNRLVMNFLFEESFPAAEAPRWRMAADGSRLEADREWELKDGKSDSPDEKRQKLHSLVPRLPEAGKDIGK